MSDSREQRVAHTEALFREVNERIAENVERFGAAEGDFVCECADSACTDHVSVPLADYELVRGRPEQFVLAPGHEDESVETTIRRAGGFQVVEKTAPRVRAIVRRLDPRAAA